MAVGDDRSSGISILRDTLAIRDETIDILDRYHALLVKWQGVKNLVSRETLDSFWTRHVCDSARLVKLVGSDGKWLDLGSGAGFPGLVTAVLQRDRFCDGAASGRLQHVHLVESNMRKVSFLRTVVRDLDLKADVQNCRIEAIAQTNEITPHFVSARALAPLELLIPMVQSFLDRGSRCFFHKGREIEREIESIGNTDDLHLIKHVVTMGDETSPEGVILEVFRRDSDSL